MAGSLRLSHNQCHHLRHQLYVLQASAGGKFVLLKAAKRSEILFLGAVYKFYYLLTYLLTDLVESK